MRNNILLRVVIFLFLAQTFLWGWFPRAAYATVTVTTATGGTGISADDTGGAYTSLTGPTVTEGAFRDFPATGTFIISVAPGFVFNTGSSVTATITRDQGSKACFAMGLGVANPTVSTITFTMSAQDTSGGNPSTTCHVTFSGIQVRPSSGTPLGNGNMIFNGTAAVVGMTAGTTQLGQLTEVAGAKNKIGITTQPSTNAVVGTDFSTKPVVAVQDQYGNPVIKDSSTTITRTAVLSSQSCGGTAGNGTLSSTPASGASITNGVMTYTAMQYSVGENIKICFTSTGITSALSNAVTVVALPSLTTQAASNITDVTATASGTITSIGNENNDKRGFVYDTSSKSLPGNVAPASSGYTYSKEETGSFSTGSYSLGLDGLSSNQLYYVRSYSHNSAGYAYGDEIAFNTKYISITITSNGTVTYGYVSLGNQKNTTAADLNQTQTLQNNGTMTENVNIKTTNATGGTTWTLGSAAGTNIYVHEFSTNGGGAWTKFTTADSYQTMVTGLAASGSQNFDFRLTAPTSTGDYQQKTITVTVQATQ